MHLFYIFYYFNLYLEVTIKKKSGPLSCSLLKEFKIKSKSLDLPEAVLTGTKRKTKLKRENSKME